jgi:glycosyltransferase involved in cell wall biosynthesis
MKILLVSQYFYPENFKGNDIAFELTKRGHHVTVLTGIPNYPQGKFFAGYGFFKKRRELVNGVKVIRTFLVPRFNSTSFPLMMNYISWSFFASFYAVFLGIFHKYDKIIVQQLSPVFVGIPAVIIKKIQKTPVFFWVLDLWPESLESAGGLKNKIILGFFEKMVQFLYRNSDKILITSKGFKKSILEKGDFADKLVYFPNWAEDAVSKGDQNYPIPELPNGFKIMFAGNVGEAQDLESIMNAAKELKKHLEIKFIIVGDGRKMPFVKEFIAENNLQNSVVTVGRFSVDAMASFFAKADVMLVSLKDEEIFNLTVPAKVQAYMSAAKPIIAMLNGEGAGIIEAAKCGISVRAGDFENLAKTILKLANLPKADLDKMRENSRNYFLENFQLLSCINNLENILNG